MKEYVEKILPKYLEMIQKHKKNIEEGKYKTRKEARDALGSAMEALRKEFPPPMPRKGGKPAKDKAVKDKDKVTDKE